VWTYNRRNNLILLLIIFCLLGACLNDPTITEQERLSLEVPSVEEFMPERVRIAVKRSCESCHGIDGHGIAGVAPAFARGIHRSTDEWGRYLRESQHAHPVSQAPPLWLDEDEIKAVAEYLATINQKKKN
jgi:cytochrome c553